jgi:hypothetical protein
MRRFVFPMLLFALCLCGVGVYAMSSSAAWADRIVEWSMLLGLILVVISNMMLRRSHQ